jgi:hypothetical protein
MVVNLKRWRRKKTDLLRRGSFLLFRHTICMASVTKYTTPCTPRALPAGRISNFLLSLSITFCEFIKKDEFAKNQKWGWQSKNRQIKARRKVRGMKRTQVR